LIYIFLKKNKIKLDRTFYLGMIAFVFFGSLFRVCVDASDVIDYKNNVYFILKTKIFEYGILTSSPMIYIIVSCLFFLSYYSEKKLKVKYFTAFVGGGMASLCLIIILNLAKNYFYA
jgi:uncharacterized membrane protein